VSDLTYEIAAANRLSAIRIAMCPIKGSVKCHANSIPAAFEQVIMLAELALFLVLATVIPA